MKIIEHEILLKFCSLGMLPLLLSSSSSTSWKFFLFVSSKQLLDENAAYIKKGTFSATTLSALSSSERANQDNDCKLYLREKRRNFKQYLNNFLMFSSCWRNAIYVKVLSSKQNDSIKRLFQCWLFDNRDKENLFLVILTFFTRFIEEFLKYLLAFF